MGIVVVGCGQWGSNLIRNFANMGILTGVCDLDADRAILFAERYNSLALKWEEVLTRDDVQGIAIATSATVHSSLAQECLKKGKNVFIEKPVAFCASEVDRLIELSTERNLILMGGHLMRYHPGFVALKEIVLSGKLGKLLFIDSYRQSFGRICLDEKNVFWSIAPHDVSMILALTNHTLPCKVTVTAESIYSSADQGVANLTFAEGLTARIITSWISPFKEQKLTVVGRKGALTFNDVEQSLIYYPYIWADDKILQNGVPENIAYPKQEPLATECAHFWECICSGTQPRTNGAEIKAITKVLEFIDQCVLTNAVNQRMYT